MEEYSSERRWESQPTLSPVSPHSSDWTERLQKSENRLVEPYLSCQRRPLSEDVPRWHVACITHTHNNHSNVLSHLTSALILTPYAEQVLPVIIHRSHAGNLCRQLSLLSPLLPNQFFQVSGRHRPPKSALFLSAVTAKRCTDWYVDKIITSSPRWILIICWVFFLYFDWEISALAHRIIITMYLYGSTKTKPQVVALERTWIFKDFFAVGCWAWTAPGAHTHWEQISTDWQTQTHTQASFPRFNLLLENGPRRQLWPRRRHRPRLFNFSHFSSAFKDFFLLFSKASFMWGFSDLNPRCFMAQQ